MKAELLGMFTYLADTNLETYQPEKEDNFSLSIQLDIGTVGEEGVDYFSLLLCTPKWFSDHLWEPEFMRHILLVRRYNFEEIEKVIMDYIDRCEGEDWMEIVQKLSRVFFWEYEDIRLLE